MSTSSPLLSRMYLRPERVLGSRCERSEKRVAMPPRVTAIAHGSSGSAAPSLASGTSSSRGSKPIIFTMRSPSASLKRVCTGSPYPVVAGMSTMRQT